jgi:hypothetical protein
MDDKLKATYHNSIYEVWLPDGLVSINLGDRNPRLDSLCDGDCIWSLITAYNPYSAPRSTTQNMVKQLDLIQDVVKQSIPYYYGMGSSKDRTWSEASLLLYNLSHLQATALGEKYEQNAIVAGGAKLPASIVIIEK